jgi:hypothetical protein
MRVYHIDVRTILCCMRQFPEWYVGKKTKSKLMRKLILRKQMTVIFLFLLADLGGHLLSMIVTNSCVFVSMCKLWLCEDKQIEQSAKISN